MESRGINHLPVGYVDHAGVLAEPVPVPVSGAREPVEFVPFENESEARAALESGAVQAYYVVAADYDDTRDVELYYMKEPGRNATRQWYDWLQMNLLRDQRPQIARRAALIGEGLIVRSLDGRRELPGGGPTFGILAPLLMGVAFVFLLFMSAGYLMQAVVDEKENRTMEVLLTSASSSELIGGKVLGIVGVGLTQLVTWVAVAVLFVLTARSVGIAWFQDTAMDWGGMATVLALGLPSYVVASALMAAIGATVTSAHEGQSVAAILFVLSAIPLGLSWLILQSPHAPVPIVLSLLPFTALPTIILRSIFASVPLWQVAIGTCLQVAYALGALWVAGRAFRLGTLRYGQRLRWRELMGRRAP
jgi:ABC-2 type transport system permease protein